MIPDSCYNISSMKMLFICTKNNLRSLTAEHVFKNHPDHVVRSAGTAADARRKVTKADLKWADRLYVMEKKHQEILLARYPTEMQDKDVICLDIPDEYAYMDEELVQMLRDAVAEGE